MSRDLKLESIKQCEAILKNHNYSFHMFRRIFEKFIDNDGEMFNFWYNPETGEFRNMRLYKYLTEIGYRKVGTILQKVK